VATKTLTLEEFAIEEELDFEQPELSDVDRVELGTDLTSAVFSNSCDFRRHAPLVPSWSNQSYGPIKRLARIAYDTADSRKFRYQSRKTTRLKVPK
jgi:hypothetical protein